MSEDKLTKTVITIAGKDFPVKLNDQETAQLHGIMTDINADIANFQKQFKQMSLQDIITLVLIKKSFKLKAAEIAVENSNIEEVLNKIQHALED